MKHHHITPEYVVLEALQCYCEQIWMHGIKEYVSRNNRSTTNCDKEPLNDHHGRCKMYTTNCTVHIHLRSHEELCSSHEERWTSMPLHRFVCSLRYFCSLCSVWGGIGTNVHHIWSARTRCWVCTYCSTSTFKLKTSSTSFLHFASILHTAIPLRNQRNACCVWLEDRLDALWSLRFDFLLWESLAAVYDSLISELSSYNACNVRNAWQQLSNADLLWFRWCAH